MLWKWIVICDYIYFILLLFDIIIEFSHWRPYDNGQINRLRPENMSLDDDITSKMGPLVAEYEELLESQLMEQQLYFEKLLARVRNLMRYYLW